MNKKGKCYYRAKLRGRRIYDRCLHKCRSINICVRILCPLKEGCKRLSLDLYDHENKCVDCKLKDDASACSVFVHLEKRIIVIKQLNRKLNEFEIKQ